MKVRAAELVPRALPSLNIAWAADHVLRTHVLSSLGEALATVLEDEPRLLLFTPSADGKVLENGRARAEVRKLCILTECVCTSVNAACTVLRMLNHPAQR